MTPSFVTRHPCAAAKPSKEPSGLLWLWMRLFAECETTYVIGRAWTVSIIQRHSASWRLDLMHKQAPGVGRQRNGCHHDAMQSRRRNDIFIAISSASPFLRWVPHKWPTFHDAISNVSKANGFNVAPVRRGSIQWYWKHWEKLSTAPFEGYFSPSASDVGNCFQENCKCATNVSQLEERWYKEVLRNCSHVYLILSVIICKYNLQLHLIYGFKK